MFTNPYLCPNMKNLCGREDFAGVDHHCPKTCGKCNKGSKNNEGRTTKALDQSKLVVKRLGNILKYYFIKFRF